MASSDYYTIEQEAKKVYGIEAAKEMCEYWGVPFDERTHKIQCRFHDDKHPSWDWNAKDNCFHCFVCPLESKGRNYGIIDFYMDDLKLTYWQALQRLCERTGIEFAFKSDKYNQEVKVFHPDKPADGDMTLVYDYLINQRGLSKETIDWAGVTANDKGNAVAFNIYNLDNQLVAIKYRFLQPLPNGQRFCWAKDCYHHALFNMHHCNPNNTLYITEGMVDALSIVEAGRKNVVSMPGGVTDLNWIAENKEWLDGFKKIILCVDSDKASLDVRQEIIRRLGAHRTSYIEINDEIEDVDGTKKHLKDVNEVLVHFGKDRVLWYLDNPIEPPMDGLLYLSDCKPFDFEHAEGWYTGISKLDAVIKKGLFSTFNVISGFRSSGKSTWINQLICNWLDQGYATFVFSGELPPHKLMSWLEITMAGPEHIQTNSSGYRQIDADVIPKMREWYHDGVIYFDKMRLEPTPENLLERIEYSVKKCGVRMVIIDNLMTMSFHCRKDEELDKQKEFCDKLIQLAHTYELAVFLVDHPVKVNVPLMEVDHIRGTGNITNLADYIFIVQRYRKSDDVKLYPKSLHPDEYNNIIRLVKNRQEGDEDDVEVYFDADSRRYYLTPNELWHRHRWDTNTNPLPTYDKNIHGPIANVKKEIQ